MFNSKSPRPPSLQSGTLDVLQAPNLGFLSQIMSNLDQTFRIGPLATTNIIFVVWLYPILHVSSQEPSTSFKPHYNQNLFLSQSLAELSLFSNSCWRKWKLLRRVQCILTMIHTSACVHAHMATRNVKEPVSLTSYLRLHTSDLKIKKK